MTNYQDVFYPCTNKKNKNPTNILYIFNILSKQRFEKIGQSLSANFNFYALNTFFDNDYKLILDRPNFIGWCKHIVQYIEDRKIDLKNTVVIAQFYAAALVPFLNDLLGKKIKKVIYVSPFVKFSKRTKDILLKIFFKDDESIKILYNDITDLKNNIDWVQTSKIENVVTEANIQDIKKIIKFFHKPLHKLLVRKSQRNLPYHLGVFLGEHDEIVNYFDTEAFFVKANRKVKMYPFFNSKLCCFEEENFKFIDCVDDFIRID